MKVALSALVLSVLAIALTSAPLDAATASTSFNVSATVQAACAVSASSIAYPTYKGTAAASAKSTVSVKCSNPTPYSVGQTAGVDAAVGTGNVSVQTLSVLGQVPAGQQIAGGGPHPDTVTVTITY